MLHGPLLAVSRFAAPRSEIPISAAPCRDGANDHGFAFYGKEDAVVADTGGANAGLVCESFRMNTEWLSRKLLHSALNSFLELRSQAAQIPFGPPGNPQFIFQGAVRARFSSSSVT